MDAPRPETLFAEMKRYVRFDEHDTARLAAFAPAAEPHFERIAREFYDRIREHEDAHAVFRDEEQIGRLQRTLVRWLERLVRGPHDEAYYHERAKIGRMHVKIGLPQHYMFTSMALVRVALEQLTDALPGEQGPLVRGALGRLLDLELAIMIESYREDSVVRIQRVERLEHERLERALARSEHRYASAVELARVLVVGLDAAGRVALFNREAERVTGYARDEVLGQSFVEFLLPEPLREADGARILRAAAGVAPPEETWEAPVKTRSGKERTVHWQLAYAPHPAEQDVALFAIGADVTDARELHARTLQTEKLAAIGTLAAGLAHEIRNPLNGAMLHVTFLERALTRAGGNAEALEAARFIGSEIQRLSALVKDFLVFARPAPPDLKPASLREVCQRVAELVLDEAARANATVVLDFASTDMVVRLDPPKMEQVLLNLLRNAIEAVGATGGGRVVFRTRRQPRHAVIEVEDEGPGLPNPDAPIFDAFYTTKPHGTGLGLAIVHRVVTDHQGTVGVESRPGRTVFRVSVPLSGEPAAPPATPTPPAPPPSQESA